MTLLRFVSRLLVYGSAGVVLSAVVLLVVVLDHQPELEVWHTASLDAAFRAGSNVERFEDYLALEDRLFAQLDAQVYGASSSPDPASVDRYLRGSRADPSRWPRNWNRTFELVPERPSAGIVMLHGLSDSPYSMRSLAERMHAEGAQVVGLRVPGHGFAPVGLVDVEWEDMAAAVELAITHVAERVGDVPVYVFGYSNGGALAVHYALSALEDASLPRVDGIVLLSPEIGISKVAALAVWQARLGRWLGQPKLAWNSIHPEYDPYQYKSFAVNAGEQAYRLTGEIQSQITRLAASGALEDFPRTLAFQSVVDATVSAPEVVEHLFMRLPAGGHELVLFDINRKQAIEELLRKDPSEWLERVFRGRQLQFSATLLTNESRGVARVVARQRLAGASTDTTTPLGLAWPPDVYSLAHVALPFPPDDPVYGGPDADPSPGIALGNLVLRGEHNSLRVTGSDLLRMHWNPFHAYMAQRIVDFLD